jgi:hypothetical protein
MTTLLFHHKRDSICTTAWTASTDITGRLSIYYLWSGGLGAGQRLVQFDMSMEAFIRAVSEGPVVDLRSQPAIS